MREHRLREFRKRAGLARVELGEKSGVNFRTIEKYERAEEICTRHSILTSEL